MPKAMLAALSLVALLSSADALAIEFSLMALGPDWEGAENDAIDARFNSATDSWVFDADAGDTGFNYNVAAAFHRDSDQVYFIASATWPYGNGGNATPDPADRRLYQTPRNFSQIQQVGNSRLVSASGSDLPQAMAFAGDQLFVVYRDKSIDRVDRSTGVSSSFATLPVTPKGVGLGYDHENDRLIVAVGGLDEAKTIYAVDAATGSVTTLVSNISFYCLWQGLSYLRNGEVLAVGTGLDCTELAKINLSTGQVTTLSLYAYDEGNGVTSNRYTDSQDEFPAVTATDLVALMRISPWRPDPPIMKSATAGNTQALIDFDPPARDGDSAITGYTLTEDGSGATYACTVSPCTVTGLTNGQTYRFTVTATNEVGESDPSQSTEVTLPVPDRDSDGVAYDVDNCPDVANADQVDLDQDGAGDACDSDDDGDGVVDTVDAYPNDPTRSAREVPVFGTRPSGVLALLILALGLRRMNGSVRGLE